MATTGDPKMETDHGVVEAERAPSAELDKSVMQNYDRMDKEVAKYVSDGRIEISEEENIRLRRLIDKRVLVIMISTYFLQAIDKGTMSFASIMGIIEDTGMHGQQVSCSSPPFCSVCLLSCCAPRADSNSTNGSRPVSTSPS